MTAPLAKEHLTLRPSNNLSYGAAPVESARGIGLVQMVVDAVRWVVTWPRRQAVLDELSRLTDRELNDIGLNRAEIHSIYTRAR